MAQKIDNAMVIRFYTKKIDFLSAIDSEQVFLCSSGNHIRVIPNHEKGYAIVVLNSNTQVKCYFDIEKMAFDKLDEEQKILFCLVTTVTDTVGEEDFRAYATRYINVHIKNIFKKDVTTKKINIGSDIAPDWAEVVKLKSSNGTLFASNKLGILTEDNRVKYGFRKVNLAETRLDFLAFIRECVAKTDSPI